MDAPDRLSMLHPAGLAAVAGEVGCFASADGVSGATVSLDAGALASSAAIGSSDPERRSDSAVGSLIRESCLVMKVRQNDWALVVLDMSPQPLIWFAKKGMLGGARC
jgi:hypothetical protein